MNVNGEYRVAAEREAVWQALHDPATVRACLPGCEDVQAVSPQQFAGRMMARVGAVSTVFSGRLFVSDEAFPKGWQISAHAESPTAGWADGTARIQLSPVSGGTMVAYRLQVDPGGRLAAVGDRLLRGVALRMANDFFTRLTEHMMPHPPANDPQDRSEASPNAPRRVVAPLAPIGATAAAAAAPPPSPAKPAAPERASTGQRIIIGVGLAYFVFVLTSMTLGLLSRG
ncbi:MAG: carbon monoxide dehydrogenase subunit G [Magnetospirillum sp.]|nr:carbon monoxide dehydrogenase subunit G [Magnetospirillum sp.]